MPSGARRLAARPVRLSLVSARRVASVLGAGLAAGLAAGTATTAYALWEARQYTLRRVDLRLERPTPGPLTVLHLSDLHLSPRDTDRIAWVQGLASLAPDLTVITGDLLGDVDGPRLALAALDPLLGGAGAYVRGSNDYYRPRRTNPVRYFSGPSRVKTKAATIDITPLAQGLADAGWHDLDNARATVEVAGWRIDARGVDDPHIHRDRYAEVAGPFDPAADLHLGVAHAPYARVLDAMASDGAELILCGHTHGGQVGIPMLDPLVTNCDLPNSQARGASSWRGAQLHVSAGLGTNPYAPIRVACRPEATLLTIT